MASYHVITLYLAYVLAASWLAVASWTPVSRNCSSAVPAGSYSTAIVDKTSRLHITTLKHGLPATWLCPGVAYNLSMKFTERRLFIIAASQGVITAAAGSSCLNRLVSSTAASAFSFQFLLPCNATGEVSFAVSSVSAAEQLTWRRSGAGHGSKAGGGGTYMQLVLPGSPILPAGQCEAANCAQQHATDDINAGTALVTWQAGVEASSQSGVHDTLNLLQQAFIDLQEQLQQSAAAIGLELALEASPLKPAAQDSLHAGHIDARQLFEGSDAAKLNAQKLTVWVNALTGNIAFMIYGALRTLSTALEMLSSLKRASATGLVTVDNVALLNFASGVSGLGAGVSITVSRIYALAAGLQTPLNLARDPVTNEIIK